MQGQGNISTSTDRAEHRRRNPPSVELLITMTARVTSGRTPTRRVAIVLALALGVGLTFPTGQERATSPPWPVVPPERQGFDSDLLAELLDHVRTKGLPLHNLVLIRRGQLILDASIYPYSPEDPHDLASVTKSITSVLVGIAIDKGFIDSVRQPVVSLLPAAVSGKPDAQRRAITVENLLTMTSGLDCGFEPGEPELAAMRRSDNWPAFALALPMRAAPGTHYAYCSCNNHLLSAILSARTGDSALAFARRHLFDPLGIAPRPGPRTVTGSRTVGATCTSFHRISPGLVSCIGTAAPGRGAGSCRSPGCASPRGHSCACATAWVMATAGGSTPRERPRFTKPLDAAANAWPWCRTRNSSSCSTAAAWTLTRSRRCC